MPAITTTMRTQVSQLYVSLFGRAPEVDGLTYWVKSMGDGATFAQIAQQMYDVQAARAYYPGYMTNQEVVGQFYKNVLGRTADSDGLAYWTNQMATKTKGQVIADMVVAVTSYTGTDASALASQALFNNKVTVAQYYGENGGTDTANKVIATVTASADSVTAAKAAALALINPAPVDTTPTYALTSSAASVAEGGAGVVFTLATKNVAAGTVLSYTVTGTGDAASSTASGQFTVDASGLAVSDVVKVPANSVYGDSGTLQLALANGKATSAVVAVTDSTAAPVVPTYAVTASGNITEGATETFTITTTGVAAGTQLAYTVTGTNNAAGQTTSGLATIDASGKAVVSVVVPANTTFGDAGTLKLALSSGSATSSTVTVADASTDPSTVAKSFSLTANADSFTGGSAADTFDATGVSNSLQNSDVIVGGAGNDVLRAAINGVSLRPQVSGVESIELTATGTASTINMLSTSGVTSVSSVSSTVDIALTNAPSTLQSLTINQAVADGSNVSITYATGALSGAADSFTVNLDGVNGQSVALTAAATTEKLETVTVSSNVNAEPSPRSTSTAPTPPR